MASEVLATEMVHIRFDGRILECRRDTSVAVALWENGIRHLSHSPKYGRPRGVTCARGHCTACLMRVDGIPNVRVCELPVRDGMEIGRQDGGAFYAAPMQKALAAGSSLFPVGFYYKWFTRPPFLSRLFLEGIRPLTGVGRLPAGAEALRSLPPAADLDHPELSSPADQGRFDTVVVGAGPAGLAAATEATGRVLVVDDHAYPGGQRHDALRHLAGSPDGNLDLFPFLQSAWEETEAAEKKFAARDDAVFLAGAKAIAGYFPDGILLRQEGTLKTARFDNLVWAAGALDTLGLFPGNDTPGVIGPRALYRLLVRDGLEVKGRHALVIGSGLDFWLGAALLAVAGARLGLVVTGDDGLAGIPSAVKLGWPLNTGLELDSIAGRGEGSLRASFRPGQGTEATAGTHLEMDADLAVVCNRGKPAYDIPYQLGAPLTLQPGLGGFALPGSERLPSGSVECTLPGGSRLVAAGEAAGNPPVRVQRPTGEVDAP